VDRAGVFLSAQSLVGYIITGRFSYEATTFATRTTWRDFHISSAQVAVRPTAAAQTATEHHFHPRNVQKLDRVRSKNSITLKTQIIGLPGPNGVKTTLSAEFRAL
jgi:hypothetical protein